MEGESEPVEEQSNIIEYKNALFALTEKIKILEEKNESLEVMNEELKKHFEKMKRENGDLRIKYHDLSSQKKQAEAEAQSQIRHLKIKIDTHEPSLDSQRSNTGESQEIELIKKKLIRKIEGPCKIREEALKQDIEKLEEQASELKRENTKILAELEDAKQDHRRELEKLQQKSLEQLQELQLEINTLQEKANNFQEKEMLRGFRRDCEEYKRRNMELQKEIIELKQENIQIKEKEKTLMLEIDSTEDTARIENERQLGEIEKIKYLLKYSDQKCQDLALKLKEKEKEVMELDNTNDELNAQGKELELQLSQVKARCMADEQALLEREAEIEAIILELKEEEKGKQITDRNEKEQLQNQIRRLEKALGAAEEVAQEEMKAAIKKISNLERESPLKQKKCNLLQSKLSNLQKKYENLKAIHIRKEKSKIKIQNELEVMQKKFRALKEENYQLIITKEHLECSINTLEENVKKLSEERELWKNERFDLQNQIAELTKKIETLLNGSAEKISRAKNRKAEFRSQLLQADLKIKQLSSQISNKVKDPLRFSDDRFNYFPIKHRNLHLSEPKEHLNMTSDPALLEHEIARTLQFH